MQAFKVYDKVLYNSRPRP